MDALKEEVEVAAQELLAKQDEITQLNLLLDSKEKKIDKIQSMEDTSGLDIAQHPQYKKLLAELAQQRDESTKCTADHAKMQVEHKNLMKKNKALMQSLMDTEQKQQEL